MLERLEAEQFGGQWRVWLGELFRQASSSELGFALATRPFMAELYRAFKKEMQISRRRGELSKEFLYAQDESEHALRWDFANLIETREMPVADPSVDMRKFPKELGAGYAPVTMRIPAEPQKAGRGDTNRSLVEEGKAPGAVVAQEGAGRGRERVAAHI